MLPALAAALCDVAVPAAILLALAAVLPGSHKSKLRNISLR